MFRQSGWPELLFLLIFGGLVLVPTIWAIVDIIQRPPEQFPRYAKAGSSDKTGWVIALVVGWLVAFGWLVAIVYLIVVRRRMGAVRRGHAPPAPGTPPSVPGQWPWASSQRSASIAAEQPIPAAVTACR